MEESRTNESIRDNYNTVLSEIEHHALKVGRDPSDITIVGVTKKIDYERIIPALKSGLNHIGELIEKEMKQKVELIKRDYPETNIHIIGNMQSNKVKYATEVANLIQSVEREKILNLLNSESEKNDKVTSILLQTDFCRERELKGLNQKATMKILETLLHYPFIEVKGIMSIAPLEYLNNERMLRKCFKKTKNTFEESIKPKLLTDKPILSMGMSNDYKLAVEEGSTLVRIGTAIFGQRN